MTTWTANSETSLQSMIGDLRELWNRHKFVKVTAKTGKARSVPQNSIGHAWYGQIARELREDTALGWKCYCKLHHGVPILRSEDAEFRESYDAKVRDSFTYEQKLTIMEWFPVTSLMTIEQKSKYLEAVRADFEKRGVMLEFPEESK